MSRAELAFLGGSVITVDPSRPRAEAIAVADGRIVAVGTDREVGELIGPTTDVIELEGETVLPGFQDAHLHFAHGGMAARECDLYETTSPAAHAEAIVAYAARNPTAEWIVGGGWSMDDFTGGMPTREFLDALVPDRPVALVTRDGHTSWVNTRALELAGITATTPDPVGGVIDRDADGAPSGTLQETAMRLVQRLLPEPSQATWEQAILDAQRTLHALGITACQEASLDETLFGPYRAVAERGAPDDADRGEPPLARRRGRRADRRAARSAGTRHRREAPHPWREAVPGRCRREQDGRDARGVSRCRRLRDRRGWREPVRARAAAADRRSPRLARLPGAHPRPR